VLGVLCAAAFAVSATGADPPRAWWLLLPAVTWAIYLADHLRDGRRNGASTRDYRHRFCFRNAGVLTAAAVAVAVSSALFALLLFPPRVLAAGGLVAVLAVAHLAFPRRGGMVPKELSAAAIYTAGIWFVPMISVPAIDPWVWALVVLHFLAALANLVVFSLFTLSVDVADGQTSIVRSFGASRVRTGLIWVAFSGALLAAVVVAAGPPRYTVHAAVLFLLGLTPVLLDLLKSRFTAYARYRTVGDLSFVLMAIPWLIR